MPNKSEDGYMDAVQQNPPKEAAGSTKMEALHPVQMMVPQQMMMGHHHHRLQMIQILSETVQTVTVHKS